MERGYIKVWRKSLDTNIFYNPEVWQFWCWCLMKASYKKHKIIIGFQEVSIMPGQFIFGRREAAAALKTSERKIRNYLNLLKTTSNLTIKSTNKFSIITIINWDTYQSNDFICD